METRVHKARTDDSRRQNNVIAARKLIYNKNFQITSAAVEKLLRDESLVPTTVCPQIAFTVDLLIWVFQNAFSERLAPLGFDMFSMFVIDLLHDWEIGIAKLLILHLLRIVESVDGGLVIELDRR